MQMTLKMMLVVINIAPHSVNFNLVLAFVGELACVSDTTTVGTAVWWCIHHTHTLSPMDACTKQLCHLNTGDVLQTKCSLTRNYNFHSNRIKTHSLSTVVWWCISNAFRLLDDSATPRAHSSMHARRECVGAQTDTNSSDFEAIIISATLCNARRWNRTLFATFSHGI